MQKDHSHNAEDNNVANTKRWKSGQRTEKNIFSLNKNF